MQSLDRSGLISILNHAARHSLYYREFEWAQGLRAGKSFEFPRDVPLTRKDAIREDTAAFFSDYIPPEDGEVSTKFTSGTTGEPMEVRRTAAFLRVNDAENTRLRAGWGEGDHKNGLLLKSPLPDRPPGTVQSVPYPHGYTEWLFYSLEARAAIAVILEKQITVMQAYPSLMREIFAIARRDGVSLPLKHISTVGETLSSDLVREARDEFGCTLCDIYGTIETGIIAAMCARCGEYHPADQHLKIEIIEENGAPTLRGAMGKVIATTLCNTAMPLVRYDTGDLARISEKTCQMSQVSISQILGRQRHTFKLADGRRLTPMLPAGGLARLGVRRYKLIQKSLQSIEFHYVPERKDVDLTNEVIQPLIDTYLDPDFTVEVFKKQHLPRLPGGKYLMHESMLPHDDA